MWGNLYHYFVTGGWTGLLIQVENVFCLEVIRKRLGNQGRPKRVRSLACRGEVSQSQAFPSLAAGGVARWVTHDGGGPQALVPQSLGFAAPLIWLWGSSFPPGTCSSCGPWITSPCPVPMSPTRPHATLCCGYLRAFPPPHINSVSPTFRTKAGLQ